MPPGTVCGDAISTKHTRDLLLPPPICGSVSYIWRSAVRSVIGLRDRDTALASSKKERTNDTESLSYTNREPGKRADKINPREPVRHADTRQSEMLRARSAHILTRARSRPEGLQNKSGPCWITPTGPRNPATTYFPAKQYHRRGRLNGCVRDGNRCDPTSMVTENAMLGFSP